MENNVKKKLIDFLENGQTDLALAFVKAIKASSSTRSEAQHRALFLWFNMIEKEAENAGVTWNELIGHTHQLRITSEGLHVMCKQLMKALWGKTSTKQIQKVGDIEVLEQHFVDLFSKVGLTLPAFPSALDKPTTMKNIEKAKEVEYPTYQGEPTI